jgi:hypothetical protein
LTRPRVKHPDFRNGQTEFCASFWNAVGSAAPRHFGDGMLFTEMLIFENLSLQKSGVIATALPTVSVRDG